MKQFFTQKLIARAAFSVISCLVACLFCIGPKASARFAPGMITYTSVDTFLHNQTTSYEFTKGRLMHLSPTTISSKMKHSLSIYYLYHGLIDFLCKPYGVAITATKRDLHVACNGYFNKIQINESLSKDAIIQIRLNQPNCYKKHRQANSVL